MAAKKKAKKKTTKSKKTVTRKTAPKKKTVEKKLTAKRKPAQKKSAKKVLQKKAATKAPRKRIREKEQVENLVTSPARTRSGAQAGDLQGISRRVSADSESVDELLEEGNTFEAGVVTGVEHTGDDEIEEVHTHEVPVDDVPGEYLDED